MSKAKFALSCRLSYCALSFGSLLSAQDIPAPRAWFEAKEDPGANFYSIQRDFYLREAEEEGDSATAAAAMSMGAAGFADEEDDADFQFKRWEAFMEPRVYPSGDVTLPSRRAEEAIRYLGLNGKQPPPMGGDWHSIGPTVVPASGGGAGRLNFLRFHPADPEKLFVGSPGGGLWTSVNGGINWTTETDQLNVLGVSDLVIDPVDERIRYLATGDGDGSDTHSIGVLKTMDGGASWNTTGLAWTVSQSRRISKLLINPDDPRIVIAAASNGIYRTTDAGLTWTQVFNTSMRDLEFKPGDPSVVYASGTRFYKSVNGGATFAAASNLPTTQRFAIAVTQADANLVYAIGTNQRDFQGFYRSADGGNTFSTKATSPNIMGYSATGSDAGGGQAFYDLGLCVSQTDANYVVVGGINVWKSINGGSTWSVASTNSGVHTDVHAVEFRPGAGNILFAASDGGLFKTTTGGSSWTNLGNTLAIAEMYRLGVSPHDPARVMSGWQDNGTNLWVNGAWKHIFGGDGFECFFDWADTNYLYAETQNGGISRSSNGGKNWTGITPPGQSGPWNTSWLQDPKDAQVLYYGSTNIWKTANRGANWAQLGTLPGSGSIRNIVVDPANSKIIYAVKATSLARTLDGGATWKDIAAGLPTSQASINHVTVDPGNSNTLWVALSGFSAANKVFKSTNAGTNWTPYSEGLPNLPANYIIGQKASNGAVYVAMDVGVFYRNNSKTSWEPYFANLPNVSVRELEIYYGRTMDENRIRAATFGRGLWESPLYEGGIVVSARKPKAEAKLNLTASAARGGLGVSFRLVPGKPGRYRAELKDLAGKTLQSLDLGEVTGTFDGLMAIDQGEGAGVRILRIEGRDASASARVVLE